jgi:hypothetical protein
MKMDAKLDMLQQAAMLGKTIPPPKQQQGEDELDDIMEVDEIEESLVSIPYSILL